jgi:hypothetical protein
MIPELMNETLPLVEPLTRKAGIDLQVHLDGQLPKINADRYRVQTALFNLIQNAMEAMPEGGRMTISARADAARREVSLTVQDTGKGIQPELMERVCEPFFSTHQEEGMRGLGLAIVQDIVKIHGASPSKAAARGQRSSLPSPRQNRLNRPLFRQTVPLDLGPQGLPIDPQPLGGAALIPSRNLQRLADLLPFRRFERRQESGPFAAGETQFRGKIFGKNQGEGERSSVCRRTFSSSRTFPGQS